MAETAIFSSFRRPSPQPSEPHRGGAGEAAPELSPREQAPELPPFGVSPPFIPKHEAPLAEPVQPTPGHEADRSSASWIDLSAIPLDSDLLGLAHPDVISLVAYLPGFEPLPLSVDTAGLYRPVSFRPAPWDSFAYDVTTATLTGLAAGTRILTARGEIEVERLRPGDAAMALRSLALLPIAWIGRSIAAGPAVRIEPGALGPNVPRRTLYLGREQSVFIKHGPVPARSLVNGTTIREADAETSDLFHIDVGLAEILLAEGIPLSSGHRGSSHAE